jgi:hypothetical protein
MDKGIVGAFAFVAIASAGSFAIQYNAPGRVDAGNTAPAAPAVEAAAAPIAEGECYRFLDRLTRVSPLLKQAPKIEQVSVLPNIYDVTYYDVTYIYSYGGPYLGGVGCGTSGKMETYIMDIGGPPRRLIPYEKASLDIISAAILAYTGDDAHAVDMAESILEKQPRWVNRARVEFGLPGGGKISIGDNRISILPTHE